jgi:hypothetical protein
MSRSLLNLFNVVLSYETDNRSIKAIAATVFIGIIGHYNYSVNTEKTEIIKIKQKYTFTNNGFTEFMMKLPKIKQSYFNSKRTLWN